MKRIALAAGVLCATAVASVAAATSGSQSGSDERVALTTGKARYEPGASIVTRLANRGDRRVLVLGAGAWCSLFAVERRVAGAWRRVPACADKPTALYALPPAATARGVLGAAQHDRVVGTASPGRFDGDVRSLPVLQLPTSGLVEKAREHPQGVLPASTDLGPGLYRIILRYRIGTASAGQSVARSPVFVIAAR